MSSSPSSLAETYTDGTAGSPGAWLTFAAATSACPGGSTSSAPGWPAQSVYCMVFICGQGGAEGQSKGGRKGNGGRGGPSAHAGSSRLAPSVLLHPDLTIRRKRKARVSPSSFMIAAGSSNTSGSGRRSAKGFSVPAGTAWRSASEASSSGGQALGSVDLPWLSPKYRSARKSQACVSVMSSFSLLGGPWGECETGPGRNSARRQHKLHAPTPVAGASPRTRCRSRWRTARENCR